MVGHKDSVTCIAEDGNILLTGSDDLSIGIWNTQNWFYDHYGGDKKKKVEAIGFMNGHLSCKYFFSSIYFTFLSHWGPLYFEQWYSSILLIWQIGYSMGISKGVGNWKVREEGVVEVHGLYWRVRQIVCGHQQQRYTDNRHFSFVASSKLVRRLNHEEIRRPHKL